MYSVVLVCAPTLFLRLRGQQQRRSSTGHQASGQESSLTLVSTQHIHTASGSLVRVAFHIVAAAGAEFTRRWGSSRYLHRCQNHRIRSLSPDWCLWRRICPNRLHEMNRVFASGL